jgi:hypothetical protein
MVTPFERSAPYFPAFFVLYMFNIHTLRLKYYLKQFRPLIIPLLKRNITLPNQKADLEFRRYMPKLKPGIT